VSSHADAARPPATDETVDLCDIGYAEILRELAMYGRCAQDDECVAVPLGVAAAARHRELVTRVEAGHSEAGWLTADELGTATNARWLPRLESSLKRYLRRCEPGGLSLDRTEAARCSEGMCVPLPASSAVKRRQRL
jgi:hypothetical protein